MTSVNLQGWQGVVRPASSVLEGRYCRLEPLDPSRHAEALYEAAIAPGAEDRFRFLFARQPASRHDLRSWAETASTNIDPLFFAVIDASTARAGGWQSFMRIDTANGVIEIGNIMWGPAIARTRVATEAMFLFAELVFSLGYRRLEWKCDDRNIRSKRAAERFGFQHEGLFRQHMVLKGENRDTAWFSIVDGQWPNLKAGYQTWLSPLNFDDAGRQRSKLILNPQQTLRPGAAP